VHVLDVTDAAVRRPCISTRSRDSGGRHRGIIESIRFQVAFALTFIALAASAGLAATARAGTYVYCDAEVYSGQSCPDESSAAGQRHTFKNQVGNWGTVEHPGCDLNIFIVADYAPTTTTNGSPKYYTSACNTAVLSFPNNTQLLREYVSYSCYCNSTHLMYGYGDFY
jgi:hypothetical protein